MSRLIKLDELKHDPWLGKAIKSLKKPEHEFLISFIEENDHLGTDDFELASNRAFLDKPKLRSNMKSWTKISEILSALK